ncbi:glycosyltransferase [Alsobacter sp. R-9]
MRILHVVPTYWPAVRYGGPIVSVHGLAKAQVEKGHDVDVFTTNVDGPGVVPLPTGEVCPKDGVRVTYFATELGRRIYRSPAMMSALRSNLGGYDVVHVHSVFLWPTVAACRECIRQNRPFILSPRGMLVPDLIARKSRAIKTAWLWLYGALTVSSAAAIHATSVVEAEALASLGLSFRRIEVIPNGIDPDEPKMFNSAGGEGRTIVSIGRINWKKGLDRIIESLPLLVDVKLIIAGNDEDGHQAVLESRCRELGVDHRVMFCGAVYGEEKWKLLAAADLFVAPSYSENFGNAVLEALTCGTPVVVTPEVGLSDDILRSGSGLVVRGDPEALASAIAKLLSDHSQRRAMSRAARELAITHFSWSSVARKMDQAYSRAIRTAVERDAVHAS